VFLMTPLEQLSLERLKHPPSVDSVVLSHPSHVNIAQGGRNSDWHTALRSRTAMCTPSCLHPPKASKEPPIPTPVPCSTHPSVAAFMNEEVEKDRASRRFVQGIVAAFVGLLRAHLPEQGKLDDALQAQFKEPLTPGVTDDAPTNNVTHVKTHLHALLLHLNEVLCLNSMCWVNALILVEKAIRAGLSFRISSCRRIIVAALILSTKEHFDEITTISDFKRAIGTKLGIRFGTLLPSLEMAFFGPVLCFSASVSPRECEQYCQVLRQLMRES